ncbi:MAG: fumarylacetoacetate hydrolase family protein [Henriciella sp.]
MKLARYEVDGLVHLGSVEGQGLTDLTGRFEPLGDDMKTLIRSWPDLRGGVEAATGRADHHLSDVRLLAPITRPGKIWGLGLNYADHIAETGRQAPDFPTFFAMAQTSICGPGDPIDIPLVSDRVDYEAELVFIVGRGGRHVPEGEAADRIFGYCCGNDVSVRDWQRRTGQFSIGKSFDSHAPLGPWIVTADEIDPLALAIRCEVNGERRQDSNTCHQIFKPAYQLAHLSQAMTMEAGDVIFTGTPGGVGAAYDPPKYLRAGDVVRVEIEGLGCLENPVRAEPDHTAAQKS